MWGIFVHHHFFKELFKSLRLGFRVHVKVKVKVGVKMLERGCSISVIVVAVGRV